jgi:hypothetical protein
MDPEELWIAANDKPTHSFSGGHGIYVRGQ